jgi:hypothetical protein
MMRLTQSIWTAFSGLSFRNTEPIKTRPMATTLT